MNLKELRPYFREFSGRDNLADAKIDNLANRAISYLSPKVIGHFGETYVFRGLPAGTNTLDFTKEMNSIRKIWVITSTGSYIPMESYLTLEEFLENNPIQTSPGIPGEWVKVPPMSMAKADRVTTSLQVGENWTGDMFDGTQRLVLLFSATPTELVHLRLMGRRKIFPLVNDEDFNILTKQEPLLLCMSMLYFLEFYKRQYTEAEAIHKQIISQIAALDTTSIEAEAEQLGDQIDG